MAEIVTVPGYLFDRDQNDETAATMHPPELATVRRVADRARAQQARQAERPESIAQQTRIDQNLI